MLLEIMLVVLAIILFVLITGGSWIIGIYNWYHNLKQDLGTQGSNIKTEYQRRADIFYNLANAVKSHKNFEKSTMIEVIKARNQAISINPKDLMKGKGLKGMESAFSKLLAVFEQYPELKSHTHYEKFMEEVRITEDRINVARTSYNDIVREYNVGIKVFPRNIVARWFDFRVEDFYKNEQYSENPESFHVNLE